MYVRMSESEAYVLPPSSCDIALNAPKMLVLLLLTLLTRNFSDVLFICERQTQDQSADYDMTLYASFVKYLKYGFHGFPRTLKQGLR